MAAWAAATITTMPIPQLKVRYISCASTLPSACSHWNSFSCCAHSLRSFLSVDGGRAAPSAACVGTPDHMHAPQAMSAMRRGLHVYCQKPLTSHVAEARMLQKYAVSKKLVTQMGIQVHSAAEYRMAVDLVHNGTIGKVKEVHAWSNKKWGDMTPRPSTTDPVPATLDWDGWIGVARPEGYIKDYCHPGNWRKRLEFGTGTFGDMGCHIYDPVFGALGLTAPMVARSRGLISAPCAPAAAVLSAIDA